MLSHFVVPALVLLLAPRPAARAADWLMYLRDTAHSSFNASETHLDASSMPHLRPAWTTSVGAYVAAGVTVADGVLYFGAWDGNFYAIDAVSGKILWSQYLGKSGLPEFPGCQPQIGISSQATVDQNRVYVGGGEPAVYALDRSNGSIVWRLPLGDPDQGAYIWSSVTLYNHALYVGLASLGDCPLALGLLARIDLSDPDNPILRYLYPEDTAGGGIWSTPAIDADTNTVFVTTGTGLQDVDLGMWGGTLAAFDATTLEMKAHFFLPTNDWVADIEWGTSPVLFTTPDGTPLVAAAGKDGILYALRRDDLSVAWTTPVAISCGCPECGCGSLSTPAFDGKTLYMGAGISVPDYPALGTVYAIDPQNGGIIWRYMTEGVVIAPVTVANGLVYASTTHGVNIFNATTGDLVWDDQFYSIIYSQPVVVNGTLYCSYLNGDVVAWTAPDAE